MDDDSATLAFVHDNSQNSYYNNMDIQYDHTVANADITNVITISDPYGVNSLPIEEEVEVTYQDVQRGYVILDGDYTKLYPNGCYGITLILGASSWQKVTS